MTIFIRLCLLVLSFIGLGSCDLINHAYDIQVSPHPPYSNSRMFWLNNDEIMFVGQDLFDTKKEKLNVYKWNVSNSKTEEIISDVNGICYNRGYVRYGKKISGTTTLFSGTMGKEQQEAIVNAGEYGSLTCKPVQANVHNFYDAPNPRFHLLQLLEEDGVLELPPQLDNATAYLHSQTSIKPKPIPKLNFWNTYGASNEFMYIPHLGELTIFAGAFMGACIGFLWYNTYPAQVFMGDTGSLAIGGIIAAFAIIIRKELMIPLLCGIFLAESLSVMIQVSYFKYTKRKSGEGKRIFLMSPLHHHFQKKGYHESKIVARFWVVGIMLAIATIITLKTR